MKQSHFTLYNCLFKVGLSGRWASHPFQLKSCRFTVVALIKLTAQIMDTGREPQEVTNWNLGVNCTRISSILTQQSSSLITESSNHEQRMKHLILWKNLKVIHSGISTTSRPNEKQTSNHNMLHHVPRHCHCFSPKHVLSEGDRPARAKEECHMRSNAEKNL